MTPAIGRKPTALIFLLWTVVAVGSNLVVGCSAPAEEGHQRELENTNRPEQQNGRVEDVRVGPARVECYGPFRRMCLVIDGGHFYDEIEGFEHEPGYEYRLRIARHDAWPGEKEPPQDAGRYGYRLLELISKTRVAGTVTESHVAPARVQCPWSDQRCLLVDGRPFPGAIGGFQYEPGFEYRMRIESYGDQSHRLLETMDRQPAKGTVEEISVGPWRVQCYEDAPVTAACIVVNGDPFYGRIEGLARRHGYVYSLQVEKYDLYRNAPNPPPELPKYGYRVLKVLSETPAKNPPPSN